MIAKPFLTSKGEKCGIDRQQTRRVICEKKSEMKSEVITALETVLPPDVTVPIWYIAPIWVERVIGAKH